jgi:tRNA threonylcarbamoyladenosine biosynthesis protein TsaB
MILVAIETSTPRTSVALGSQNGILGEVALAGGRPGHELVVPAMDHLLRWSKTSISSVAGVVVGVGPGLFTGLRVGVQSAKTLAQVLRVPIVGLGSLDTLAFAARHSAKTIVAAIDARRGEVFYALYRAAPGGVARTSEPAVGPPERLAAEIQALGEDVLLLGDGAREHRRAFESLGRQVEPGPAALEFPRAGSLIELSIPRFEREEFDRPTSVLPVYMRKSDAEIAWDRRAGTG